METATNSLEIHYKIIRGEEVESGTNEFISDQDSAKDQAQWWVNGLRQDGWEVSAWDNEGKCF